MYRIDKTHYYLNIAFEVAKRGTCLRRNYGAVIVNNDEIISTGYSGAPRSAKNCVDIGYCMRKAIDVPHGERYELCRSVHAEMNALIHASRRRIYDGIIYLMGMDMEVGRLPLREGAEPCTLCKRMIINAGLKYVITEDMDDNIIEYNVNDWIENDKFLDYDG